MAGIHGVFGYQLCNNLEFHGCLHPLTSHHPFNGSNLFLTFSSSTLGTSDLQEVCLSFEFVSDVVTCVSGVLKEGPGSL